jgi:hypothetical protein
MHITWPSLSCHPADRPAHPTHALSLSEHNTKQPCAISSAWYPQTLTCSTSTTAPPCRMYQKSRICTMWFAPKPAGLRGSGCVTDRGPGCLTQIPALGSKALGPKPFTCGARSIAVCYECTNDPGSWPALICMRTAFAWCHFEVLKQATGMEEYWPPQGMQSLSQERRKGMGTC